MSNEMYVAISEKHWEKAQEIYSKANPGSNLRRALENLIDARHEDDQEETSKKRQKSSRKETNDDLGYEGDYDDFDAIKKFLEEEHGLTITGPARYSRISFKDNEIRRPCFICNRIRGDEEELDYGGWTATLLDTKKGMKKANMETCPSCVKMMRAHASRKHSRNSVDE